MSFKEILYVDPQLDGNALTRMDNTLSKRFGNIAKKFGKGLLGVIAGGGIVGAITGILDRIISPLKEVQDSIQKSLSNADDVVTHAAQFETTAGKLLKLTMLAKSKGLDQETLFMMMTKFQTAVGEAKLNPKDPSAVQNYTKIPDSAEAFFQFIQGLQKLTKEQQALVEKDVFGERLAPNAYSFMQANFKDQFEKIHAQGSETYTPQLLKMAKLHDEQSNMDTARELQDVLTKGNLITERMITINEKQATIALIQENNRIKDFESKAVLQASMDIAMAGLEELISQNAQLLASSKSLNNMILNFSFSRWAKGMQGKGDK